MKTIHVSTKQLIKFISSENDGEPIPGAVISADTPRLFRTNDFEFKLQYIARSKAAFLGCFCSLDEELDVVTGSNRHCLGWENRQSDPIAPTLVEDGVTFRFESGRRQAQWIRERLILPDPFDSAKIPHTLSCFKSYRAYQMATLEFDNAIHLAIVSQHKPNSYTSSIFTSQDGPVSVGEPCKHNEGVLIPYSTTSEQGIKILWLTDNEIDELIDKSTALE